MIKNDKSKVHSFLQFLTHLQLLPARSQRLRTEPEQPVLGPPFSLNSQDRLMFSPRQSQLFAHNHTIALPSQGKPPIQLCVSTKEKKLDSFSLALHLQYLYRTEL